MIMRRPTNQAKRTFKDAEHDILRLMEALRALNLPTAVELLELTLAEVRDQSVRARVTPVETVASLKFAPERR